MNYFVNSIIEKSDRTVMGMLEHWNFGIMEVGFHYSIIPLFQHSK